MGEISEAAPVSASRSSSERFGSSATKVSDRPLVIFDFY